MADSVSGGPGAAEPAASSAPTIAVRAGSVITGTGFLPGHAVTIRLTGAAENVSDYLTYTADASGDLYAELPTGGATGQVWVAATDRRADPGGACKLLWSNTAVLPG